MAGARQVQGREISITQAAMAALGAGCDMVLLCNQSTLETPQHSPLDALLAQVAQALQTGPWRADAASHGRRLALLGRSGAPSWDALHATPHFAKACGVVAAVSQGR
jgi:beta-N-acetylhexosaminidase